MAFDTPLSGVPGIDAVLTDPFAGLAHTMDSLQVNSLGQLLGQDSGGALGSPDFTGHGGGAFDFKPVQADGTIPGQVGGAAPYMPTSSSGSSNFGAGSGSGVPSGVSGTSGTSTASSGVFTTEQIQNARVIAQVGHNLGATQQDIQTAIAVGLEESGLRNLGYGDRTSLGIFQQQDWWGTQAQRTDPAQSARLFFAGGADGSPGLLDIKNRANMTLGQAGEAVQKGPPSSAYDNFGTDAQSLIAQLHPGAQGSPSHFQKSVIQTASKFFGVPYVWGGTNPTGFDCSGLVQYVYGHLGVSLPRLAGDQANAGPHIPLDQLKPGDLVAWQLEGTPFADHIAIYAGNGQIIQAPHPGGSVEITPMWNPGAAWGVDMSGFWPQTHTLRPSRSGDRTAPPQPTYTPPVQHHTGGYVPNEPSGGGGTYHPPKHHSNPNPVEHTFGGHDIPLA